jgi:hypothetical protein
MYIFCSFCHPFQPTPGAAAPLLTQLGIIINYMTLFWKIIPTGIAHKGIQPLSLSQLIAFLTLGLLIVKTSNRVNSHTTENYIVPNTVEFYVLLKVHFGIIFVNNQLDARSCWQPQTYVKPGVAITVHELLIMSGVSLETCWAIKKHWNNKFHYTVASCLFISMRFRKFRVCGSVHLQIFNKTNNYMHNQFKCYCFVPYTPLDMFRALLCPSSMLQARPTRQS